MEGKEASLHKWKVEVYNVERMKVMVEGKMQRTQHLLKGVLVSW